MVGFLNAHGSCPTLGGQFTDFTSVYPDEADDNRAGYVPIEELAACHLDPTSGLVESEAEREARILDDDDVAVDNMAVGDQWLAHEHFAEMAKEVGLRGLNPRHEADQATIIAAWLEARYGAYFAEPVEQQDSPSYQGGQLGPSPAARWSSRRNWDPRRQDAQKTRGDKPRRPRGRNALPARVV